VQLRGFKYDRMKLRHVLFVMDPKYKKKKGFAEDKLDIDDNFVEQHEDSLKAKEIEKAEKKFAKENEKLVEEGSTAQKDSVLKERVDSIKDEFKRLAKEQGTKKASLKRDRPPREARGGGAEAGREDQAQ